MKAITEWMHDDELIKTSKGEVSALEWCKAERERFKQHGGEVKLRHRFGKVCMELEKSGPGMEWVYEEDARKSLHIESPCEAA